MTKSIYINNDCSSWAPRKAIFLLFTVSLQLLLGTHWKNFPGGGFCEMVEIAQVNMYKKYRSEKLKPTPLNFIIAGVTKV